MGVLILKSSKEGERIKQEDPDVNEWSVELVITSEAIVNE